MLGDGADDKTGGVEFGGQCEAKMTPRQARGPRWGSEAQDREQGKGPALSRVLPLPVQLVELQKGVGPSHQPATISGGSWGRRRSKRGASCRVAEPQVRVRSLPCSMLCEFILSPQLGERRPLPATSLENMHLTFDL